MIVLPDDLLYTDCKTTNVSEGSLRLHVRLQSRHIYSTVQIYVDERAIFLHAARGQVHEKNSNTFKHN